MTSITSEDQLKVFQQLPAHIRAYLNRHPRPSFAEDCAKLKTRELLRKEWVAQLEVDCAAQKARDKEAFDSWRPEGFEIGQIREIHTSHWTWPQVEVVGFDRDNSVGTVIVTEYNPPGRSSRYAIPPSQLHLTPSQRQMDERRVESHTIWSPWIPRDWYAPHPRG